jgi:uncharacterized Zn finger protein (UPF0148 family)
MSSELERSPQDPNRIIYQYQIVCSECHEPLETKMVFFESDGAPHLITFCPKCQKLYADQTEDKVVIYSTHDAVKAKEPAMRSRSELVLQELGQ